MASSTPHIEDTPGTRVPLSFGFTLQNLIFLPGAWPETPAVPSDVTGQSDGPNENSITGATGRAVKAPGFNDNSRGSSSESTTVGTSPADFEKEDIEGEDASPGTEFAPITTSKSRISTKDQRPSPQKRSTTAMSGEELARVLSRRQTGKSDVSNPQHAEEQAEIERLMSRMFGQGRQNNSEEEKTRHVGVIFKNLTVKGVGLGAALQPTVGDIFLGLPRKLGALFRSGKKVASGPPVRTIINSFSGAIRPGEMLLVLGRPGSGCSTFLKVLGNQRAGFKSIDGEVSYGGATAETMGKDYRGEVLYNPEDDLHYATLSVQRTLEFALKTRTPGKESRMEGETRAQYVQEFLKTVTQLCKLSLWAIQHFSEIGANNEL
jgi:ATP-binding cassette subfamily G (WHITE) protein 2 (SNQ2)